MLSFLRRHEIEPASYFDIFAAAVSRQRLVFRSQAASFQSSAFFAFSTDALVSRRFRQPSIFS
jgi:hypothetical protein